MATTQKGTAVLIGSRITATDFIIDQTSISQDSPTDQGEIKDEKSETVTWLFCNPGDTFNLDWTVKSGSAPASEGDQLTLTLTPQPSGSPTTLKVVVKKATSSYPMGAVRQSVTLEARDSLTLS